MNGLIIKFAIEAVYLFVNEIEMVDIANSCQKNVFLSVTVVQFFFKISTNCQEKDSNPLVKPIVEMRPLAPSQEKKISSLVIRALPVIHANCQAPKKFLLL